MNKLTKTLFLGAAVLALSGAAIARPDGHGGCGDGPGQRDPAKFEAFVAKHQARLHDKLQLKPEQEADWKAFVAKTRPAERPARPDWESLAKLPTPERLDRMQALAREREQRMEARAAAVKAFYATLAPEQQKTFDAEFMSGMHRFRHH